MQTKLTNGASSMEEMGEIKSSNSRDCQTEQQCIKTTARLDSYLAVKLGMFSDWLYIFLTILHELQKYKS